MAEDSASDGPSSTNSTPTVLNHARPEPPWSGWIETTGDALIILEAARRGIIPRITRRPHETERKMITSGSVFVFDEDESGIKRWTDGLFWSPSRISGNFLLYRETQKKGQGHKSVRKGDRDSDDPDGLIDGLAMRRNTDSDTNGVDKQRERMLFGSLTNNTKFKAAGLMKKTFSVIVGGVAQHLVSYYSVEDIENGRLRCPSSLPELLALEINPAYLARDNFRLPPIIEIGPDGQPRYRRDADPSDPGPMIIRSSPLTIGVPLLPSSERGLGSPTSPRDTRPAPYRKTGRKSRKDSSAGSPQQPNSPQPGHINVILSHNTLPISAPMPPPYPYAPYNTPAQGYPLAIGPAFSPFQIQYPNPPPMASLTAAPQVSPTNERRQSDGSVASSQGSHSSQVRSPPSQPPTQAQPHPSPPATSPHQLYPTAAYPFIPYAGSPQQSLQQPTFPQQQQPQPQPQLQFQQGQYQPAQSTSTTPPTATSSPTTSTSHPSPTQQPQNQPPPPPSYYHYYPPPQPQPGMPAFGVFYSYSPQPNGHGHGGVDGHGNANVSTPPVAPQQKRPQVQQAG